MGQTLSIIRSLREKYRELINRKERRMYAEIQKKEEEYYSQIREIIEKKLEKIDAIKRIDRSRDTIFINLKKPESVERIKKEIDELYDKLDKWEIKAIEALAKKQDIPPFEID